MSGSQIGNKYNIDHRLIDKQIKEYNIIHLKNDKDYIKVLIDQHLQLYKIAEKCKCTINTIRNSMKKLNLYDYFNKKQKELINNKKCCICGKSSGEIHKYSDGNLYCRKHYLQVYRYGHILKQTIYDSNKYIITDNYAKIELYTTKGKIRGYALIDLEDVPLCKKYKWYLKKDGYIVTTINNDKIYIQNILLNTSNMVDHINKKKNDNRKINLRIVTHQQNSMNMGMKNTNTSGVTGVRRDKIHDNWEANITYKYKVYAKHFKSFDKAVEYRIQLELKYFKEYSPHYIKELNLIELYYFSQKENKYKVIQLDMEGNFLNQ